MNVLTRDKRRQMVSLLVEGNSLRGISRILDISYNTVLSFVPIIGEVCDNLQDRMFNNLSCRNIEIDEIWSFCHTRQKNLSPEKEGILDYGNLWTFVALDRETKLVLSWLVGKRNLETAKAFVEDIRKRISGRTEISTDGFKAYIEAVEESFGNDVDFGMLVKIYKESKTDPETVRLHASPEIKAHRITGNPEKISTSLVERQNLTMRQSMRRFVRKTNGFSKKAKNHNYAIALHFAYYNFCRIHSSLRVTPAIEAGVTDHVWSLDELVGLIYHKEVE